MNSFSLNLAPIIAGLALATSVVAAETSHPGQPNIVLILADEMGMADLSSYGSPLCRTPNIDQLAREGVRFLNAYAACTVCSPTRTSLITGQYPARLLCCTRASLSR